MLSSIYQVTLALVFGLQLPSVSSERVCNNSPLLCDREYNKITHLGAHDSPFVRNSSNFYTPAGDQFYTSTTQLSAGVRLLTAQVHAFPLLSGDVEWRLCHTKCILYDAGLLSTWLAGIRNWLDNNKHDVVTILLVNSDDATASQLDAQFQTADIAKYAYTPADTTQPKKHWPTLNKLIDMDKRLIVFIASLDPTTNTDAPYLLDEFTFVFENNYDNTSPEDFSCEANRPDQYNGKTRAALDSGRMALMNHFLYDKIGTIEIPAVEKVHDTNAPSKAPGNFGDAAKNCTKMYGSQPTLTTVDFFNVGPAIVTVDTLNGVKGHVCGRKKVSEHTKPFLVVRDGTSSCARIESRTVNPVRPSLSRGNQPATHRPASSVGAGREPFSLSVLAILASSVILFIYFIGLC